ncbi:type II CAAX endopeptidase family protein [Flavobacterium sp. MMLR14_040]|uniref:CPBP family intramembrane glutamic endopeptidase n=1 Tax=Flavobacterium sp. MMLR14_040 TaxID=3093843 RepID=UPI00298FAAD1|nr:type II CAAX endopeptidase family protein [Flavobacterium sp. MMLR14_040]MDW8849651.1 type II CAAX endopeptidase family protein [Flavobacterium sp. MMLR14_040]
MQTLTTKQKIFNFPLTKIILALIVTMALVIIGQQIIGKLLGLTTLDRNYRNLIKGFCVSVLALTGYILFFKYYEKRKVTELATNGLAKNLIIGILIGVVLQSLTILVIYATGSFNIVAVNPVSFIIIPVTVAFTAAILEEILIRGILFRVLEEKVGSYIALALSAIIFGALHLSNPGANLVSALCVSIEAGILLGAAFMYSRNLWFPIAIHFAWNFMQSGIFGAITSGNEKAESLLVTKIQGSVWITGGEFGPEGSFQAIIFCSIASVILLYLCHKENKIVKPYWKK